MNDDKPIITAEDLLRVRLPKVAGRVISFGGTRKSETPAAKPLFDITTPTAKPTSSAPPPTAASAPSVPTPTASGGMTFDEAFTRLRMIWASIPQKNRQAMLPILVERLGRRIADPADREDFRTLAMSLEEAPQEGDALQRYMPLLLILSMMRSG